MGGKSKKVTVGYKYYAGMHQVYCLGPIDHFSRLVVGEKEAWTGIATGGSITVNKPGLFGGEAREGGVSGTIDVEMGEATQDVNSYLSAQLGTVPAYRGVAALVLRQLYLGNNPYLKKWAAWGQRIHVRQDGIEQWYDATAEIPDLTSSEGGVEDFEGGVGAYTLMVGSLSDFEVVNTERGRAMVTKSVTNLGSSIRRIDLISLQPTSISFDFRVDSRGNDDTGRLSFVDASGNIVFQFIGSRAAAQDSLRRARVRGGNISGSGGSAGSVLDYIVDEDEWYSVKVDLDFTGNTFTATLFQDGVTLAATTASTGLSSNIVGLQFGVDANSSGFGQTTFANIRYSVFLPSGDLNPAHIIRECLTDPIWGMGYPEADIDDASFQVAADTLYAEGMGMSLVWDRQTTIDKFVSEIVRHIDASLFISRFTGKFTLRLTRDDYDPDLLLLLDESNVSKVDRPTRPEFGETANSVSVVYWDSSTGKKDSITLQDPASIQMQGGEINTTIQYPGFTKRRVATMACARDLKALSNPFFSCSIHASSVARDLDIGDTFKFSWAKWKHSETIMRVVGISLGDGKTRQVIITAVEDVFSTPLNAIIGDPGSGWVDPSVPPQPAEREIAVEAPYYEVVQVLGQTDADTTIAANPDIGFVAAAAGRPGSAINAQMWTDAGAGYAEADVLDFCPTALLASDIVQTDTVLNIEDGTDLDLIEIGTHVQLGDELVRVDAINTGAGTVTVGRGILDTVPVKHAAGALLMFWDAFVGFDNTEYANGEEIDVKITPISGSGQVALVDADALPVQLSQRAYRPYPPGDMQVEGVSYEQDVTYSGEINVTWVHRDRLQQTSGDFEDHFDGTIGPEAGTTYRLQVYIDGVLEGALTQDDIAGTSADTTPTAEGLVGIEVHSKRDGVYSLQGAYHEFIWSGGAGSPMAPEETDDYLSTEGGDIMMTED